MSKLEPVTPIHISKATIDRLLKLISDGYWQPGQSLPPQRELAKTLGIGMSTLREALQAIQALGVVETRHGEGTFITARPYQTIERLLGLSLALGDLDLESLFEARMILERALAFHAARRGTEAQIIHLFDILEQQEIALAQGNSDTVDELDLAFHTLVGEMASNPFLQQIEHTLTLAVEKMLRSMPHTMMGLKLHRAVADAIREHNPQKASQASRNLIDATAAIYIPYLKNSK